MNPAAAGVSADSDQVTLNRADMSLTGTTATPRIAGTMPPSELSAAIDTHEHPAT